MIQNHVAYTALSLEPPSLLHCFQKLSPEGPQQVGRREPGTLGAPGCLLVTRQQRESFYPSVSRVTEIPGFQNTGDLGLSRLNSIE